MRLSRIAGAVLVGYLIAGLCFLAPGYVTPDSVGVMAWLRSAAVNGDLLFYDEWSGFKLLGPGFAWFKEVTATDALANHWWIGTALVSAPFWLVSHAVSLGLPGPLFPDDGFFGLDLAMLAWSAVLFGALATLAGAAIIRGVDPRVRWSDLALALSMSVLGTPAFWYLFRMPLGTHAAGAMLVALLAWLCWRSIEAPERASPLVLGLCFGLAVATRLQHLVLLPALLVASSRIARRARFLAIFASGAALPLALQAIVWSAVYGSPLGPLASGGNSDGLTWMPFRSFPLVPVLISSWHGLLSWSPVVVLAVGGWMLMIREGGKRRTLGIVLLTMFAGELVANVAFDRYWWGGMGFGARRFVDLFAPFAVGLAAALRWRAPRTVALAGALSTAWSVALMLAAAGGTLGLRDFVSSGDLLRAVVAAPARLSLAKLRSPILDPGLLVQSLIALAILSAVAVAGWALARRGAALAQGSLLALLGAALLLAVLLVAPTRQRAAAERARFGLSGEAARRAGALLDQRGLLSAEIAYLEARGDSRRANSTRREVAAIDQVLAELGVQR